MKKPPKDPLQLANFIGDLLTGESEDTDKIIITKAPKKQTKTIKSKKKKK